jgi:beta-galactosidase
MPASFEQLAWYGRGPHESYGDRKAGAAVGVYQSTVTDQYHPYVMPQEHGNKTDVRWLAVTNEQGAGVMAIADPLMESSASHFTVDDLYQALHTKDLSPRAETIVNLDHKQMGLGGASCGPGVLEQYLLTEKEYRFKFLLKPID